MSNRPDRRQRPSFAVRRGQALGDRLIWRYPGGSQETRRQLMVAGINPVPESITIGYYFRRDEPAGAPAFMPVNTAAAIAALAIDAVQVRICEDLAIRARNT